MRLRGRALALCDRFPQIESRLTDAGYKVGPTASSFVLRSPDEVRLISLDFAPWSSLPELYFRFVFARIDRHNWNLSEAAEHFGGSTILVLSGAPGLPSQ